MNLISRIDDSAHRDSSIPCKSFSEFPLGSTAVETRTAGSSKDVLATTLFQQLPIRTLSVCCVLNQIWTRATPVAITYVNSGLVAAVISICTLALTGRGRVSIGLVTKKQVQVDNRHAESNFDHQ